MTDMGLVYQELTPVKFVPMTTTERDALENIPDGLTIHNTTTAQLEIYLDGGWYGIQDGYGAIEVGDDANFALTKAGINPLITLDSGDYLWWDRTNNLLYLVIASSTILALSATNLGLASGVSLTLTSGFVSLHEIATPATPGADAARVYAKDVGGVTRAHLLDHAATESVLAFTSELPTDFPSLATFNDHNARHEPGGADPMAVDAAAATGSLRTLGTAATAACAGNDARLSDARTPAAHGPSKHTEGTAWRLTYYNADGDETEIALGADGTFLESNGAAAAPAFRAIVHGDVGVTSMKQSVMLTAGAGRPTTTSGCAAVAVVEAGTNDVDYCVLAFDKDTDEYAFWGPIATPDNWDGGTLTAVFYWSCAAGVGGANKTVCWSIQMIALDNDDAIDRAWGTAVTVTDTWIADADIHESAASDAITPATTVSREGGDLLFVRVMRDVSGDDLAGDARLIGVKIEYGVTSLSS